MKDVQDYTSSPQPLTSKISSLLILALVALSPLLVIPVITNFMVTTKLLLLSAVAVGLAGVYVFHAVKNRILEIPRSPIVPGLLFFGVAMTLSSLLSTRYPIENMLGVGGALISFSVIALVGSLLVKGRTTRDFMSVFNVTVIVLAVLSLLQSVGYGPSRLINTAFDLGLPNTSVFSLAGSPFVAAQVFGLALLANGVALLKRKNTETLTMIAAAASAVGLAMSLFLVLPGKEASPLLLPFGVSWTIAVDVLKSPRTALIGVGPENYAAAYQQLRPVWVNTTAWWNNSFGQAGNVPLTLLTTTGLLGLGAWLLLFVRTIGFARANFKQEPALVALVVGGLLLQLALPLNMVVLAILAAAFAFLIGSHQGARTVSVHLFKVDKREFNYENSAARPHIIVALLPLILGGLVALAGFYGLGRAYAASYNFFQSSLALQANDAVKTYELQQAATALNPYLPIFRSNFALTNLAIATALSQKTDVTPAEQEQVGQLIQQAIREARAATLLRPEDSQTWQALGQVYRSLIGSAEGADQWATSAYVQAISTNPNDPLLRIELGGLLYSQEQYNDANLLFQQAAELKPDLPNAWYNLANGLKAVGNYEQSKQAYQQTLTLIPADSEDYVKINQELEALEAEMAKAAEDAPATTTGSATTPAGQAAQSSLPSIVNQNVSENDQSVVSQPSSSDLNVNPAPAATTAPAASPAVSPTPTP